jgi:hypothetical protein
VYTVGVYTVGVYTGGAAYPLYTVGATSEYSRSYEDEDTFDFKYIAGY